MYEIGVVYVSEGKRLYLAVDEGILISMYSGTKRIIKRPHSSVSVLRGVAVDELCERWGVTPAQLDIAAGEFLIPSQLAIKPRNGRRAPKTEANYWKGRRTVKIA